MNKIGNGWDEVLNLESLEKILEWVSVKRTESVILPEESAVLKAFELSSFEESKVVIIGQDPYPGKDKNGEYHAMGMAFSSNSKVEIPASLKNIFKEIMLEMNIQNKSADLTKWAKQGVLLLNTVLTVEAEKANSHKKMGWEEFTTNAVSVLGNSEKPVVFMLWGKQAQENENFIKQTATKLILKAAHPSPLSAKSGFFGCNHFLLANQFLKENGLEAINWAAAA
jgi:uracil-DNA glycosylase